MKHQHLRILLRLFFCLTALVAWAARTGTAAAQDAPAAVDPTAPYISEVSPVAGPNAAAWVEVIMGRAGSGSVNAEARLFLPLISAAAGAQAQAVAAAPAGPENIHGWHLRDGDGKDYDIPLAVGNVPQGTIILVLYDGQGPAANDLDSSDGHVTLHTQAGLTNPFEAVGDQVGLYDPGGAMRSFVAWGQPALDDDDAAVAAGLWANESFVVYDGGFGAGQVPAPIAPGQSIGIWQAETGAAAANGAANWVAYAAHNSTPGALNPPPAPLNSTIPADAVIGIAPAQASAAFAQGSAESDSLLAAARVNFAWSGMDPALAFELEVAGDTGFAAPQVAISTTTPGAALALPEGVHYWRVRSRDRLGHFSAYLGPFKLEIVDLGQFTSLGTLKALLKSSEYKIQHKDSAMLDIGGGANNIVGNANAGDRRYPADKRWDGEHVDANNVPSFGWNGIDNWYCVRASTAMLNDYFGGNLRQDRISYYAFEELPDAWYGSPANLRGVPENDLGFGIGIGSYSIQEKVLAWALGGAAVTPINYCPPNPNDGNPYSCPNPAGAPMTFAEVKGFIDAGRPFMSINLRNGHARVVDGYWEISASQRWVHLIDPVPADTGSCPTCTNAQWLSYTTFTNNHERAIVPPAGVPSPRQNEATLSQDSDGDGITNFDESLRFKTNPLNPDSDGDGVKDKNDLAEYIFDVSSVGTYVYTPGMTPKTSDFDGDGKRKELDPDNDNDGSLDGCEDANQNGEFNGAGETSNFFALGGQPCQPKFAILDPINGQARNAGDPANPDKLLIRLKLALPPALTPKPVFLMQHFAATIGGLPAPSINGAQVGQEYWLLVQAPAQPSSSFYTLTVSFDGTPTGFADQADTEANAVFYIPRARVDTLVVLDRSGSMLDANKLASAKNAARLYIDQWAVNDRVGVVTFGDTATTPLALTPVLTGTQALTDAKNLIDAAAGGGQTAMGPGLLAGQQQLTTNGDAGHLWALMLLTDGQENVEPKWANPAVSGVIVPSQTVVHTVGIGQPNDIWFGLLQQIAGATGGSFAAVDDPSLVAASEAQAVDAADAIAAFPTATANRLADAYKWAAEQTLGEQRLFEGSGVLSSTKLQDQYRFYVDDVPSLLLTANFNMQDAGRIEVTDPTGAPVAVIPGSALVQRRTDATHDQYRIANPTPGLWSVKVILSGRVLSLEYLFFASADTPLTLNLVAGDPVPAPTSAAPAALVPLVAFLADDQPIPGASVQAQVQTSGSTTASVMMLDDGLHGDGLANDGIYGASLTLPYRGPFLVKAKATLNPPAAPAATYRFAQVVVNP